MAQNTDLNVSPYYDDYDETKNFHRILFRPSNAIQARELTQLQTIIQNQVERFGNHVFDEGSLVMGGTITVNKRYHAVKVQDANPNVSGTATTESYRAAAIGKYYQGQTTGTVAKVVNTVAKTTDGDPLTLYVNYVKTGDGATSGSSSETTFENEEIIEEVALSANGTFSAAGNSNNEFKLIDPSTVTGHSTATSIGSSATVRAGILYVRGFFVRVDEQTILLDKYSEDPTYRIGLQITESLQSYTDDSSLLDNATGTSNENAPGANRLKITLTLVKKAMAGTQDIDNFIEMSRVETGIITKQVQITSYNVLERTLARRTYDESGDYVVKPFTVELREHLNTKINNGLHLKDAVTVELPDKINGVVQTTTTTAGDATKFVSVISPGKGYVKGFEIDKPAQTILDFDKARTTQDAGASAIPFEIGNYYELNNCSGQPEFGTDTSTIAPFGVIDLHDTKISTAGAAPSGLKIGQARVRYFNFQSGTASSGNHSELTTLGNGRFRIHLFDIRMFTKLTTANTAYALTAGQRVKGTASGAKGTVAVSSASGATTVWLMDVEGTFSTSDTIRLEHATASGKAVSAVRSYSSDRVRALFQECRTSADTADFTADTMLKDPSNRVKLSGTFVNGSSSTAVTGVGGTLFSQQLKEGDVIEFPSGATSIVSSVTSDIALVLTANGPNETGVCHRLRAKLLEQNKTVAISATPKDFISSVTPNQVTLRKQTVLTFASSTVSSPAVGTGVALVAEDANDYIVSIHDPGDGDGSGAIIDTQQTGVGGGQPLAINTSSNGTFTLTHADSTAMEASDAVKVIYAVQKPVVDLHAVKTINRSRGVKVTTTASTNATGSASGEVYGTNINDEIITLGVPDVYALRAVYESNDTTDALPPSLSLDSSTFAGDPGDKITGGTSGAVAKIIQVTGSDPTTVYFYYVTTDILFSGTETVTNETSTSTSTNTGAIVAGVTGITVDSKDISGSWLLDDGQRDGYYGHASIKRRPGAPTPGNSLLIIFDYFTAGSGNFFTVNSYSGMNYENIPTYVPNIVDPSGLEPDGEFELADAVDYRSYVGRLAKSSGTHDPSGALDPTAAADVSLIVPQPLAYTSSSFHTTGAVTFDLPKSGQSLTTTALSHYLPRIDKIALSSDSQFMVIKGEPADEPAAPATPANSILLHTLYLPPYTTNLTKVSVQSHDHKRFTMKEIGRIQGRVKNLERVTSLNALEQETNLTSIRDSEGIERFKSGFVTDNFRGHKIGDVNHPDYKIGVDRTTGTLRPMHYSRFVDISLNTGASGNYQKTGDLITLPYTEEAYVTVDKASTTEYVNPYDIVIFNGTVTLSPSRDLWFDTQRLPSVRRTIEGDYDTVLKGVGNALGTVWNNWQTDWVGEPVTTVEQPPNRTVTRNRRAQWGANPRGRQKSFPGRGGGNKSVWNMHSMRAFETR